MFDQSRPPGSAQEDRRGDILPLPTTAIMAGRKRAIPCSAERPQPNKKKVATTPEKDLESGTNVRALSKDVEVVNKSLTISFIHSYNQGCSPPV